MTSLYEISEAYKADLAVLEDLDLDEKTFKDTLESVGGELELKLEAVVTFIRNIESVADAKLDAATNLQDQAKRLIAKAEWLRGYVQGVMLSCSKREVSTPYVTARIKPMPDILDDIDLDLVPTQYLRTKPAPEPEPMKAEIKKLIKEHGPVPWAKMITGRTKLEIG